MARNRKKAVRIDYSIIFLMMLLCIIGLVAIYVAGLVNDQYTNNFLLQQSIWIVISTGVVVVIVLFSTMIGAMGGILSLWNRKLIACTRTYRW